MSSKKDRVKANNLRKLRHDALKVVHDCFGEVYTGTGLIPPSTVRNSVRELVDKQVKLRLDCPEATAMLRIPILKGETLGEAAQRWLREQT